MSRTLLREMLQQYPEKTTWLELIQDGSEEPQIVHRTDWHYDIKDISQAASRLSELYPEKAGDGMQLWGYVPPWVMQRAFEEGWDKADWKRWCNGEEGQACCVWKKRGRSTKV